MYAAGVYMALAYGLSVAHANDSSLNRRIVYNKCGSPIGGVWHKKIAHCKHSLIILLQI